MGYESRVSLSHGKVTGGLGGEWAVCTLPPSFPILTTDLQVTLMSKASCAGVSKLAIVSAKDLSPSPRGLGQFHRKDTETPLPYLAGGKGNSH